MTASDVLAIAVVLGVLALTCCVVWMIRTTNAETRDEFRSPESESEDWAEMERLRKKLEGRK